MAIEGSLDLFQLPEILQLVSHQDKTGILTIQGETDIVAISFENGRVVAADALNQTLEESLGEVLAGQGLVSPVDFASVAREHQAGKGRLMDLLVEHGYVGREQLMDALRLHTYRLLIELLVWRQGEFKFYSGEEVAYEEGFRPISVEELLIRSVEEAAGEGHPTIPDSRSVYEPAEPGRPVRVRREGEEVPPDDGETIWLTETDQELLDELASGYTVAALVKRTGQDEYRVRYTLHRLLEAGVAQRRSQTGVSVPPSQPEAPAEPAPASVPAELVAPPPAVPPPTAPAPPPAAVEERVREAAPPRGESRRPSGLAAAWPGWLLALVPAAALAVVLTGSPLQLILPFPWQGTTYQNLEKELQNVLYLKIDIAAKTYFLLEGRFPDDLRQVVDLGLLSSADLRDPRGRALAYRPQPLSYVVEATVAGEPVPATSSAEAITGNFLLDPDFLLPTQSSDERPLVLLD